MVLTLRAITDLDPDAVVFRLDNVGAFDHVPRVGRALHRERPDTVFSLHHFVSNLVEKLNKIQGAHPVRFVGQGSREGDKGMTQKQQKEILDQFRNGEYNILVATSVGEEGLDIPSTDAVIFYEPVSSAIRLIQRRGRTGRNRPGEVFIFVTLGSRDEAALWSSRGKEQQMQDIFAAGRLEIDVPTTEELAGSNFLENGESVQTTFRKN